MAPATSSSEQSPDSRPPDGARKAALLCPECDHRSPPGGDWVCRSLGDREIRRCPECNAVVERRPTFDDRSDGESRNRPVPNALQFLFSRSVSALQLAMVAPARAVALSARPR